MIEIIPAIDLIDGRLVRLSQGAYDNCTIYRQDPVEAALAFEQIGVKRLHVVDLDGAKASEPMNLGVLERIASRTAMCIEFGGGVKSEQAVRNVLDSGAQYVICGSIAALQPQTFVSWLTDFTAQRLILGADCRDGMIAVDGWSRQADVSVQQLIGQFVDHGLQQVICTDISRDGMLQGPSLDLYGELMAAFPQVRLIASGGVGSMEDIKRLDDRGVPAVVVGKAIYEGRITLKELEQWLQNE